MAFIYELKINNKSYIGASTNIKPRIWKHINCLKNNKHPNKKIQTEFNISSEVSYKILEEVNTEIMWEKEKEYIAKLKPELNMSIGGKSGSLGVKRSEETKEKLRQINSGSKNPNYGKHGKNNKRSKPVIAYNDLETLKFESIMDGAIYVKGDFSSIAKVCKNNLHKKRYGYYWKYEPVSTISESGE